MIKGSMMYDQHGRKRKVKKLYASKKAKPNFAKQETKTFKSASEALNLLNCGRLDYHEGVKNVWSVMMPKFVDYKVAEKKEELVNFLL